MRSEIGRAGMFLLILALGLAWPHQLRGQDQNAEVVIGIWEGELDVGGGTELTIVFAVERSDDGGLTGTLQSPDQSDNTIALSSVTFVDGTLTLVAADVPGTPTYTATPSEDGTTLNGVFTQSGGQLPLDLMRRE